MLRRNISGVYILHQFEGESKKSPTCFEDCPENSQDEWLNGLDSEALRVLAKNLGKKLRGIGDQLDIVAQ